MRPAKWTKWAAIAGVTVLLTSGCSMFKSEEGQQIDPPPNVTGASGAVKGVTAVPGGATVEQGIQVTLYMKDMYGYVAPVSVRVPKTVAVAKTTLEYMVDDGASKGLVPAGFKGLLPKGTKVLGLDINKEKKTATVDFSKEFTQSYNATDERKMLEAVTWALTGFPDVKEVWIRVEGKELKEMPQGGLPVDGALSRGMGINLERAEGAEFGQTTPVTLYFLGQTDSNFTYYVPVTRMIKRTNDSIKATLEQLIAGPSDRSRLSSVMAKTVDVPKVEAADGLITVNFTDTLLGPDKKAPGEALQSVVLSLTELAGESKVQIKVNNDVKVNATDNQVYSKPVSRPVNVNPIKM